MSDFLQNHQRLATFIVVIFAIAVVAFLFLISGSDSPPTVGTNAAQPIVAHSQNGPVIAGEDAAREQYTARQIDYGRQISGDLSSDESVDDPVFFDINSDGVEEALVVARRSGDSKPIDWFLFTSKDGSPVKLFERTRVAKGEVMFQGPMLVETEGIYAPGDEECCPSSSKRTYYVWKVDGLVVSRIEAAPPAATP